MHTAPMMSQRWGDQPSSVAVIVQVFKKVAKLLKGDVKHICVKLVLVIANSVVN